MNPEPFPVEVPFTKVNIEAPFRVPAPCRTASVGSCFSDRALELLSLAGFECGGGPNGTVYNPVSIRESVERAIDGPEYSADDFFEYGGLFHGYGHHGSFSRPSLAEAVADAESARVRFREFLKTAQLVLIVPATAVVFRWKKSGRIAANCHKVPGTEFERGLLTRDECLDSLKRVLERILDFSPDCRIVAGVSPVRHHPGDPVLNARSKALVLSSLRDALDGLPCGRAAYFPAFEILNDELRDYRFYGEDLVHPGPLAEQIILSRFAEAFLENGRGVYERSMRLKRSSVHREINPDRR